MKTSLTLLLVTMAFTSLTALVIETTTENSSDTFPTTKNPAVDQPCDTGTTCFLCFGQGIIEDYLGLSNWCWCWGPDSRPKESTCPKKNFPWLLVIAGEVLIALCVICYVFKVKLKRLARRIRIRNDPERQPLLS